MFVGSTTARVPTDTFWECTDVGLLLRFGILGATPGSCDIWTNSTERFRTRACVLVDVDQSARDVGIHTWATF